MPSLHRVLHGVLILEELAVPLLETLRSIVLAFEEVVVCCIRLGFIGHVALAAVFRVEPGLLILVALIIDDDLTV